MTTTIVQGDYDNIRSDYTRHTFFLSVLKPKSLWSASVTSSAARGITAITFDSGSGLNFNAIEAPQSLWVGSGAGKKDHAELRIRSVTSGDSGVTGTVNVAWHGHAFGPGAFLTFVHDYPIYAKYPWIGQTGLQGTDEVFYKDIFDTYASQTTASNTKPVIDFLLSHRAGFILNGSQTFWINVSPSYTMSPGASISSYALTVYPDAGVTVTFNTTTGVGYVEVTDLTETYYWFKITVTDSNGSTRVHHACVFSHDPDPDNSNYPIKDFELGQYSDDWESGGVSARVKMNRQLTDIFVGDRAAVDMIDVAFSVLWKETVMGNRFMGERRIPSAVSDDHQFIASDVGIVAVTPSSTCDVISTLAAGIRVEGMVPADTTNVFLTFRVNGSTQTAVTGVVTDGIVNATSPLRTYAIGACNAGLAEWLHNGNVIATGIVHDGSNTVASSIYPSSFLAYPFNMCVGYLRENDIDQDTSVNVGNHEYELSSSESILKNNYMFSVPVDAKQSPTKWYHFHDKMTSAAAAFFVLDFHSNVLETVPIVGLNKDNDLRPYGEFQGQNLYSMVDGITRNEGIRAHWKSDRNGRLHMVYDVQILTDSERAALPDASDVARKDRSGQLSIKERPEPNIALVYGSGIFWNGTFDGDGDVGDDQVEAFCSLAPWYTPHGRGGSATSNFERQTIRSQAHMNEITGRVYAKVNNTFPTFSHAWRGDYLALLNMHFEEFWTITVQTTDNPKSLVFVAQKLILRSIECTISVESGSMTLNSTWEPEAPGLDGVTAICPELDLDIGGLPPITWEEAPAFLAGTIITSS